MICSLQMQEPHLGASTALDRDNLREHSQPCVIPFSYRPRSGEEVQGGEGRGGRGGNGRIEVCHMTDLKKVKVINSNNELILLTGATAGVLRLPLHRDYSKIRCAYLTGTYIHTHRHETPEIHRRRYE